MPRLIILEGAPKSTQHIYRAARNIRGVYLTSEGKALKEDYGWQAKSQWRGKPIEGPIEVCIKLFFGDSRRRDWDNWHKLSMDALTGIAYEDDSQIEIARVEKLIDRESPRIEIAVKPML
jgi:Holliday junction resolvase RusA-like endonuclease